MEMIGDEVTVVGSVCLCGGGRYEINIKYKPIQELIEGLCQKPHQSKTLFLFFIKCAVFCLPVFSVVFPYPDCTFGREREKKLMLPNDNYLKKKCYHLRKTMKFWTSRFLTKKHQSIVK